MFFIKSTIISLCIDLGLKLTVVYGITAIIPLHYIVLNKNCQAESYHSIEFPSALTVVTVILPKTFIVVFLSSILPSHLPIANTLELSISYSLGHTAVNGILVTSKSRCHMTRKTKKNIKWENEKVA